MKKLFELLKQNKQLASIIISVVILVAALVFVILAVVLTEEPVEEATDEDNIALANTEGMDFGFDEKDLNEGDADGEAVIDLDGDKKPQEDPAEQSPTETGPSEDTGEPVTDPTEGVPLPDTDGGESVEPTEEPSYSYTDPTEEPTEDTTEKPTEVPTEKPTEKPTEPPKDEWDSTPLTITRGGEYSLSSKKKDVSIIIDAGEEEVILYLEGVTIANSNGPAIYVRSAKKVTMTLKAGTVNTISDGYSYRITDSGSTVDAAIFSKCDLTINGSGTLNVTGNYKHGIASKDDLVIASGTINVTAKNVALSGKDCVKINSGNLTLSAGSDGIRADNTADPAKGYISLAGGTININAGNDGIQAETVIKIDDVDLTVVTGGGSTKTVSSTASHKGVKAGSDIYITGGTFDLDCADDSIHSNGTVTISGGSYTLATGDDAIHADSDIEISGGSTQLSVTKSKEAIEATKVLVSDGNISLVADDDGINAGGGNDSSGDSSAGAGKVVINGGTVIMKVGGDGIDANGTIAVTDGTVTVSVPDGSGMSVIDYDETGDIKGGGFIGMGDSSKAKNFSSSSTQGAILVNTGAQAAGTTVTLKDSEGKVILTAKAESAYSCVLISAPEIVKDGKYTVTAGTYSAEITMDSLIYG